MDPVDIKASLQKAGVPPARVATRLGLQRSTVSMVINGKGTSRRVAMFIAAVLGHSVHDLWPHRYERAAKATRRKTAAPSAGGERCARQSRQRQRCGDEP